MILIQLRVRQNSNDESNKVFAQHEFFYTIIKYIHYMMHYINCSKAILFSKAIFFSKAILNLYSWI